VQALRVIGPIMPFLTDHLWQNLVGRPCPEAPASAFLAGWPEPGEPDAALLEEIADVRRVVELGRQARSASGLKLRQPLRRLVVQGAGAAQGHADEIAEELRVKEVEFGDVDAVEVRVKPNLPLLGPKLGKELGPVRAALQAGQFEQLPGGGVRVNGYELAADEVLVERSGRPGWAVAEDDGVTVALATELDDELRAEAEVYDLIHEVNTRRKEQGFELSDRIVLTLPPAQEHLLRYADWIAREVLALSVDVGDVAEPAIAKAEAAH
jgi:isoleucyl-tRNA synthetase